MEPWILDHELAVRGLSFLGALVALATLERARPWRPAVGTRGRRWLFNYALLGLGVGVRRVLVGAGAVGAALWAEQRGFGLLPALGLPRAVDGALALVALDLAVWLQHLAFHRVPWFWALHRVHHTDVDVDTSSAGRFHPLEIAVSLVWKAGIAVALGAPAGAVVLYEALLGVCAVWTHANVGLGSGLERRLAAILVTPALHRTHHSVIVRESDSNFGTVTSLWDRLFGTLTPRTRQDPRHMRLGVQQAAPGRPESE